MPEGFRTLVVIPIDSVNLHGLRDHIAAFEGQGARLIAFKLVEEPNETVGRLLNGAGDRGLVIVLEDVLLGNKPKSKFLTDVPRAYVSSTAEEAEPLIRLIFSAEELLTTGDLQ